MQTDKNEGELEQEKRDASLDKEVTGSTKVEVEAVESNKDGEEPVEVLNETPTSYPLKADDSFSNTYLASSEQFAVIKETADALGAMKKIASTLISSKLCPLKTESDVILAIVTGNQYGFPFMTSVNNIFPINGKPTMSVHLHRALLLKHKIIFNKVLDYEPIYNFARKVDNAPVVIKTGTKNEQPDNTVASLKPVDFVTRYEFTRIIRQIDRTMAKITVTAEYKMSDAGIAGLLEKDNWVKHPARMLDARAFSIGSKEIAADILLGVYTISELADEFNVKYTVSETLEEAVIVN